VKEEALQAVPETCSGPNAALAATLPTVSPATSRGQSAFYSPRKLPPRSAARTDIGFSKSLSHLV